jgi:hypothetical protein
MAAADSHGDALHYANGDQYGHGDANAGAGG